MTIWLDTAKKASLMIARIVSDTGNRAVQSHLPRKKDAGVDCQNIECHFSGVSFKL